MKDAINWFELPVTDLARAQRFYETVLATKLKPEVFNGVPNALFPTDKGVGGALVVAAAAPFVASLTPSERARAAGAPV